MRSNEWFFWTPPELVEAQLEQCFGWASSLLGTRYSVEKNPRGISPLLVEHRRGLVRSWGGAVEHERSDVICAISNIPVSNMAKWVKIPRWFDQSRALRKLNSQRQRQCAEAKSEVDYIVESTYRTKKATQLFFDQAK